MQELEKSRADATAARDALQKAEDQHNQDIAKRDDVPHPNTRTNALPHPPFLSMFKRHQRLPHSYLRAVLSAQSWPAPLPRVDMRPTRITRRSSKACEKRKTCSRRISCRPASLRRTQFRRCGRKRRRWHKKNRFGSSLVGSILFWFGVAVAEHA